MFPGMQSLSGGGSLDLSSSAESRAGPVTVGGLTFAPNRTDTMITAMVVVGVVLVAAMLFKSL